MNGGLELNGQLASKNVERKVQLTFNCSLGPSGCRVEQRYS
jgi:hypothetical protein